MGGRGIALDVIYVLLNFYIYSDTDHLLLFQVHLSDVELRPELFDALALPIRVKRGVVSGVIS